MWKTRITELLGIDYPIIQGAMAYISESQLAASIYHAGGAGVIASGGFPLEEKKKNIYILLKKPSRKEKKDFFFFREKPLPTKLKSVFHGGFGIGLGFTLLSFPVEEALGVCKSGESRGGEGWRSRGSPDH